MKRFPVYTLSATLVAVVLYFTTHENNQEEVPTKTQKSVPPGVMEIVDLGEKSQVVQNQGVGETTELASSHKQPAEPTASIFQPPTLHPRAFERWFQQKAGDKGQLALAKVTAGMMMQKEELIREGVEMEPDNPKLAYVGATDNTFSQEEQLAYSRTFYENDTENALAGFIYATRLFESGQRDVAMEVLQASKERQVVDDFTLSSQMLMEEAFLETGSTTTQSKLLSTYHVSKPYLAGMLSFSSELDDFADTLPEAEAKEIRNLGASMGTRISQSAKVGTVIGQLVGLAVEERSLEGLADKDPSPFEGISVSQAKESIKGRRQALKDFIADLSKHDTPSAIMNHPDLVAPYIEKFRESGEQVAMEWFLEQIEE